MGYQNLNVTATVKRRTLKGWLAKRDMILRWLPIVEKLDGLSVKQAIPKKFAQKFNAPDCRYSARYLKLDSYRNKYKRIRNERNYAL